MFSCGKQFGKHLFEQGVRNGVPDIELCGSERMLSLEPKLNSDVMGGLFAPNGGVVEHYRFMFALVESARKNGVQLLTAFEVARAERADDAWRIAATDGRVINARHVVNAAGLRADAVSRVFHAESFRITGRKGEEYLLDRNSPACPAHVIFPVPTRDSKGILVIPTVEGTVMLGPTAVVTEDRDDTEASAEKMV